MTLSPFRNHEYTKLFIAQVIALVGTGLTTVALTLLAYDMAGGNAGVVLGTALAIKMIAYVVFAPIAGGLAHRFPRKALLISLDIVRAVIVLIMPFVSQIWHIYTLIFLLNLFSAGFKPVFQAAIPDILPGVRDYTEALSLSRLAYDLDNLLSPLLAGLALLFLGYSSLFLANSAAFLISAMLIVITVLPKAETVDRLGTVWDEISFGIKAYFKTPRLRALLALYLAVAGASAMVIVNTVVYVRDYLGGSDSNTAMALAAAGGGSMIAALSLPSILDRVSDRPVMIFGALLMSAGLLLFVNQPDLFLLLPMWFLIGLGWSLVQTPAGRVITRSSTAPDRSAFFSAQFSLSHACWLLAYPIAGQLGAALGLDTTALILGLSVLAFTAVAAFLWPTEDGNELLHEHAGSLHEHAHVHDEHHQHAHDGVEESELHSHRHHHNPIQHAHAFFIDNHHLSWPHALND
jgi:MFS family permease